MEILAKAVAQQHARLMVEPVDQPGCLFADQGRGEREIELLYDDEAAHRGAKLGIERAQYLRPIVDGESIGPASLQGLSDPLGDRAPREGDGNRPDAHFRLQPARRNLSHGLAYTRLGPAGGKTQDPGI